MLPSEGDIAEHLVEIQKRRLGYAFGGPENLKYEDASDPKPGPGQIVVRIRAAGVNPVETYIRSGIYGPKEFPYTRVNGPAFSASVRDASGRTIGNWPCSKPPWGSLTAVDVANAARPSNVRVRSLMSA